MFELETHDWDLKTYISTFIVHMEYKIVYKRMFES